jgi:hypothetical protein
LAEAVAVAGASSGVSSVIDKISDFLSKVIDKVIEIYSDPLKGTLVSIGLIKLTGFINIDPDQVDKDLEALANQLDNFDPKDLLGNPPSFSLDTEINKAKSVLGL